MNARAQIALGGVGGALIGILLAIAAARLIGVSVEIPSALGYLLSFVTIAAVSVAFWEFVGRRLLSNGLSAHPTTASSAPEPEPEEPAAEPEPEEPAVEPEPTQLYRLVANEQGEWYAWPNNDALSPGFSYVNEARYTEHQITAIVGPEEEDAPNA